MDNLVCIQMIQSQLIKEFTITTFGQTGHGFQSLAPESLFQNAHWVDAEHWHFTICKHIESTLVNIIPSEITAPTVSIAAAGLLIQLQCLYTSNTNEPQDPTEFISKHISILCCEV